MAENDIYDSKGKYEKFKKTYTVFGEPPKAGSKYKYYCKNTDNLKYFEKLFRHFEAKYT